MGRPASLESRPRGPWYRGVGDSPTKVTAPSSALAITLRIRTFDPREMFRPLAHSLSKQKTWTYD